MGNEFINGYTPPTNEIQEIERKRKSKVIVYFLPDHTGLAPLMIGDDAIQAIHEILSEFGQTKKIDLFLYTRGGHMMPSYRLVKLLREYCETLSILVPFRAHSAGSQICLGADELLLTRISELSPIDPSTINAFNPKQPNGSPIPISVEDVRAFFSLEKNMVSKKDQSLVEAFKKLTERVEPLALGNVYRVYEEIRILAREMLEMHMQDHVKINRIVDEFTKKYTHDYIFTKKNLIRLGLNITGDTKDESLIMALFAHYKDALKLNEPYDWDELFDQRKSNSIKIFAPPGIIESLKSTFVFSYQIEASKVPQVIIKQKMGKWIKIRGERYGRK